MTRREAPEREARSERGQYNEQSEGRTKQSDRDRTNLRKTIERYQRTGQEPPHARRPEEALYADFTNVGDYLEMTKKVFAAQEAFEGLPARVRDHFDNEPGALVAAYFDESRQEELVELGIISGEPEAVVEATVEEVPVGVDPDTGEVTE